MEVRNKGDKQAQKKMASISPCQYLEINQDNAPSFPFRGPRRAPFRRSTHYVRYTIIAANLVLQPPSPERSIIAKGDTPSTSNVDFAAQGSGAGGPRP